MTDQEFKEMVWSKSKDRLADFPKWFQIEFVEYWLTVPDTQKKNRFNLLSKKMREQWSTLGRMAQCKRTIYQYDARFKVDGQFTHDEVIRIHGDSRDHRKQKDFKVIPGTTNWVAI